ncbi:MAG: DUF3536 domain-containing protein [Candidatus Omnitrophica bacterium]|nr:DUF3536 domain-containing protein [Candidatus Omnitrophota bacterium]
MSKYICIHGHFYQPPRENPWTGKVPRQESASPFHDWNQRISQECYAPNAQAKIMEGKDKTLEVVNNYEMMSFNFGPTLLSWMAKEDKETYQAVLEADRMSQKRFDGHGSAIAQAYNHMIMPLANARDKYTQVFWGIKDFQYHFMRFPEGMWLPETAVDTESLEIMAELGIKFTILAPRQAAQIKHKEEQWQKVVDEKFDYQKPYLCRLPSGRSMVLFFYDGGLSNEIAFGRLLKNGERFAARMTESIELEKEKRLLSVATDGETYGHHHKFGEMALAYFLKRIICNPFVKLTVYGQYLASHPPEDEVKIVEHSSWSCAHGIERWRADCGCKLDIAVTSSQYWRGALREALDWLRDQLTAVYEREMAKYCGDPWLLRNRSIEIVLNSSAEQKEQFLRDEGLGELNDNDKEKVFQLLEMQRFCMLMYTSCGWFFDDISRIEPIQILQYASRAIEYGAMFDQRDLEEPFLKILEKANSNDPQIKNGRVVYERFVKTAKVDL